MLRRMLVVNLATAAAVLMVACGGASDGQELSEEAQAGRDLARGYGCAGCHGADGQGDVGPTFVGLAGSEVELEDGSTVVADAEYLTRSITDPDAQRVAGYEVMMPTNGLSEAEVASIVAWITELGDEEGSGGT